MKISITLPSIYPDALDRAIKNIRDATRAPYEIIVVSPQAPRGNPKNIVWVKEHPDDARGCNAGHALAINHATGEFMQAWVDDHYLADGWDVMARENYLEREERFHDGSVGKPFLLGLRHVWPTHVGTLFGIYYPYFPFIRRSYLKQTGWFDPSYKKGFADSDLALRIWAAGGRCEWSSRRLIVVHPDDGRKEGVVFDPSDMDLSIERWAPRYGVGWDISHLRGFNNDITPERFPQFAAGMSVFANHPGFKPIVGEGG